MATNQATRQRIGGTLGLDDGGEGAFNRLTDFGKEFRKAAADSMAADATAVQKIWTNTYDFSVQIVAALASGDAGLTAHDTNYAQIILSTDDGANGAPVTAGIWQTSLTAIAGVAGTGTWTTDIAEAIALAGTGITVAAQTIAPGANLFFSIAKTAAGVVVPISLYSIQLRRV